MGKVTVAGKAEKAFPADRCRINLDITVGGKTAGEAAKNAGEQCERLLSELKKLGIEPEDIQSRSDRITRKEFYRDNGIETCYDSEKTFRLEIPADIPLINAIRKVVENGFENVGFDVSYSVSDEAELKKELMKEAISDSRAKADILASTMGLAILGVDSADLSGGRDPFDPVKEEACGQALRMDKNSAQESDKVKPSEILLASEVSITWLIG